MFKPYSYSCYLDAPRRKWHYALRDVDYCPASMVRKAINSDPDLVMAEMRSIVAAARQDGWHVSNPPTKMTLRAIKKWRTKNNFHASSKFFLWCHNWKSSLAPMKGWKHRQQRRCW